MEPDNTTALQNYNSSDYIAQWQNLMGKSWLENTPVTDKVFQSISRYHYVFHVNLVTSAWNPSLLLLKAAAALQGQFLVFCEIKEIHVT